MQHLNEEQLVAHYYHDDDLPAVAAEEHLRTCEVCRGEYEEICGVLTAVTQAPMPERGEDYGTEVWNRLRWRVAGDSRKRRSVWPAIVAAAAILAIAFFAGVLWHARKQTTVPSQQVAQTSTHGAQRVATTPASANKDKVLLVVVTDHLEDSERILTELANADASKSFDASAEEERAGELVASNRLYRQTALHSGDARIASVLSDIEPILVELSHAGSTLSPAELADIQRRIESKGLLFKVRVLSAETGGTVPRPQPAGTSSL